MMQVGDPNMEWEKKNKKNKKNKKKNKANTHCCFSMKYWRNWWDKSNTNKQTKRFIVSKETRKTNKEQTHKYEKIKRTDGPNNQLESYK